MALSQREQIRALIDELESISPKGTFGPEPPSMTPAIADKLHRLGSLIRDYGTRERANHREREKRGGRGFNRSELLDDDAEDAAHEVLAALHELRRCPADEVERWRHAAHGALEQCGVAITDPAHRADAGFSRELRPRTREVMAARRGDAEERDRIVKHRDEIAGLVVGAQQEAVAARAEVGRIQEALQSLGITRDQLVGELRMTREERDQLVGQIGSAAAERVSLVKRLTLTQEELERVTARLGSPTPIGTAAEAPNGELRLL